MAAIDDRINRLDTSLFDHILGQTHVEDKRSLLALQAATRAAGPYTYLEIGSFLGGSIQPHIVDPLCQRIISIDPRLGSAPDSRAGMAAMVQYEDNTTDHMRELLSSIPGADLDKLTTIEASSEAIDPATITDAPRLCFIDGEHTPQAALRDAIFCLQAAPQSTIAFHDRGTIRGAIGSFLTVYGGYGYQLPHVVFVVEREPVLQRQSTPLRDRTERRRLWTGLNRLELAGTMMTGVALVKRG